MSLSGTLSEVRLSSLIRSPHTVTMHTDFLFNELTRVSHSHPEQLPPIIVAELGSKLYIADGSMVVDALIKSGRVVHRAHIIPVKNIGDVVRLHVELNKHSGINSVAMLDAISFMHKNGVSSSGIDNSYTAMVPLKLFSKVRTRLDELLQQLCEKFNHAEFPEYVLKKIMSFKSEKEQKDFVETLFGLVMASNSKRAVFPTPQSLQVIVTNLFPTPFVRKHVVFNSKSVQNNASPSKRKKNDASSESVSQHNVSAEDLDLLHNSNYNGLIKCGNCDASMFFDTKTHNASMVDDTKGYHCTSFKENESSPIFFLPPKALKFLDADADSTLRILNMDGVKDIEKFVKSLKNKTNAKFLVIMQQ